MRFKNKKNEGVRWKGAYINAGERAVYKNGIVLKEEDYDNFDFYWNEGKEEESESLSSSDKIRKELSKMKMSELRKIGDEYGVKDTSKKELINEIINEKIKRGEINDS